jgi:hypothetical protein
MNSFVKYAAGTAALCAAAAPAAAQYYPQQSYPQPYPQQVPQPYPGQPGYGYQQGYGQNPVTDIIDQLLGNRYNVTDRQAVRRCTNAVRAQAMQQYGGYGQQPYGQGYNQNYGYNQAIAAPSMRVTAITDVQRRPSGLRVTGMLSTGYAGQGQYGGQYGYQNPQYAGGDLSFRCNVDYRGQVTGIRIGRGDNYRRY